MPICDGTLRAFWSSELECKTCALFGLSFADAASLLVPYMKGTRARWNSTVDVVGQDFGPMPFSCSCDGTVSSVLCRVLGSGPQNFTSKDGEPSTIEYDWPLIHNSCATTNQRYQFVSLLFCGAIRRSFCFGFMWVSIEPPGQRKCFWDARCRRAPQRGCNKNCLVGNRSPQTLVGGFKMF